MKDSFHSMKFDSIQTLRGIAAIFVVLEHIRFLGFGAFGVDIFFCISGFLIMFTTEYSSKHFYRKRILRVVPFYTIMTIGTFLLLLLFPQMFEQTAPNVSYLVKSLLFIPFDIGNGVIQPILRIGWTLNYEMFFYLLFGLSLYISKIIFKKTRYRGVICSGLLIVLVFMGSLGIPWVPLTFYSNPIILEFALGILCYYIIRYLYGLFEHEKISKHISILCFLLSIMIFLVLIFIKPYITILGIYRLLFFGVPTFLIVICFFVGGLHFNMPSWSVRLGDISFSLYLVHYYPILFLDRKVFDFSHLTIVSALGAIFGIMLSIVIAYLAWRMIEQTFTKWLRSHLR